jgi:hypothetical protein
MKEVAVPFFTFSESLIFHGMPTMIALSPMKPNNILKSDNNTLQHYNYKKAE